MTAADFLESQAEAETFRGQRFIKDIETAERDLVQLRTHRDTCFREAAEMRTAANILREVGLRSETTPNGPFVEVDYVPKRPDSRPAIEGSVT